MVCDLEQARLSNIARLYPDIELTTEFERIVENKEIDAVVIALPVHLHFDMARRCLLANKHILIEKPMATSSGECAELLSVATKRGLTLMVGHTFVFSPAVQKIKAIIDSGELGDILYISSRRLNLGLFQTDINVVWDLAPHDISIILYLLEDYPKNVNCQGSAHLVSEIEDVVSISLEFDGGIFATIHNSWLDPNKVREMTIVGNKRMVIYDDTQPLEKIKIYDKRVEKPPHYDTFAEFHYSYHYGDAHCPYIKQLEPLQIQSQHFLDCIIDGIPCKAGGAEGSRVVDVLEAANISLRNGWGRVSAAAPRHTA